MSPIEMLEVLAKDVYVVRPNMAKKGTTQYTHVVLAKVVVEGEEEPKMKCWAQFRSKEDAELFAQAKRKQFVTEMTLQLPNSAVG
jgi:hypothetical protein